MLLRQCPLADVRRPLGWRYAPVADLREGAQESAARAGAEAPMKASSDSSPREPWVTVPAGETSVGKSRDSRTFGWDNEYGSELRHVPAFEASAYLVSNAAFQVFVQEGGYARESLWSEKGWAWVQSERVRHPRFWCPQAGGGFAYRAMFDELPMPAAWPVEVNAFEAAAYCRFRGDVRLPTEAEWCRMLDVTPRARADEEGATFHLHFSAGSPRAVDVAPSEAGRRIHDVRGNVWQWLQDEFHPLPGFRTHPLYEDFSEPYFDPDHVMLRGGSWATTGAGATVFYRLWFRRRFYQHAGFRLVRR
jgi:formylglycine-generating enzyme required for sulfatase activity